MRVLVVSQYFWPESFRINEVVESMIARGVTVDVVTGKPNYPDGAIYRGYRAWGLSSETALGATIYRVPMLGRGDGRAIRLFLNYISFVVCGLIFGPWQVRGKKYDVIFVHGMSPILQAIPALYIGALKSIPVVLWVQDLWPESLEATGHIRNPSLLAVVRRVVRGIYDRCALILVQSKAFVEPVGKVARRTPIEYFPNSVDSVFSAVSTGRGPDAPTLTAGFPVVVAGNMGVGQAVEVIIEAASLLVGQPDIHIVVVGTGSRWQWMRDEVERRGLQNVEFLGRFPVATMPGLMQQAAALLVTLADRQIFAATIPNRVQAYLAAGRPIVASLNGEGARVVIEAEAGFSAPAEDAPALAQAILALHGMSATERETLGKNGRAYFEQHFDHEMLMTQLLEHLGTISTQGSKRR